MALRQRRRRHSGTQPRRRPSAAVRLIAMWRKCRWPRARAQAPVGAATAPQRRRLSLGDHRGSSTRPGPITGRPQRAATPTTLTLDPPHASPSVRKFARELGVDLSRCRARGPNARILREDVQAFVRAAMTATRACGRSGAPDLLPWPKVDFAKFGPVESTPLTRIRKISGANLRATG